MTDTDLPRSAKKRKAEFDARVEETERIRSAMIERGLEDDEELPAVPCVEIDTTLSKAKSITASKTTVGGYKSALKLHYSERKVEFACRERPPESQSIDAFLNEQIKSYGNLQV